VLLIELSINIDGIKIPYASINGNLALFESIEISTKYYGKLLKRPV
jgi:hypothetical protein